MYFRGKLCSKNNSFLERVDIRIQHIWRLRVMGSWLERLLIECRKTKTRVITLANHKGYTGNTVNQSKREEIEAKRGKTSACESRLVLVLLLIG